VVSFTPLPLYSQGKSPQYPFDRRLAGPQSRPGLSGEEKILGPKWASVKSENMHARKILLNNIILDVAQLF
jgi:hypothetical protein